MCTMILTMVLKVVTVTMTTRIRMMMMMMAMTTMSILSSRIMSSIILSLLNCRMISMMISANCASDHFFFPHALPVWNTVLFQLSCGDVKTLFLAISISWLVFSTYLEHIWFGPLGFSQNSAGGNEHISGLRNEMEGCPRHDTEQHLHIQVLHPKIHRTFDFPWFP